MLLNGDDTGNINSMNKYHCAKYLDTFVNEDRTFGHFFIIFTKGCAFDWEPIKSRKRVASRD